LPIGKHGNTLSGAYWQASPSSFSTSSGIREADETGTLFLSIPFEDL
jgi:hypothetical protein